MTVKDILINTAILLGREDIIDYFGEQARIGEETYPDVLFLIKIIGLVVSELSGTYFPLVYRQDVSFSNGEFAYSELEKKAVKIIDVCDCLGNKVNYVEDVEQIRLVDKNSGSTKLTIVYQYLPEEYYEDSEIDYKEKDIPARVIAYGVAAEYCISKSMFEQAVMHHKRYTFALQEIKSPKNVKIKGRSFK